MSLLWRAITAQAERAYTDGAEITDCPYEPGSVEYVLWISAYDIIDGAGIAIASEQDDPANL